MKVLDSYDPFAPEVIADPYPWYLRLQREAPVYHEPVHDIWVLSRFDDVMGAARSHDAFSSAEGITYSRFGLPMMITSDPPEHTRLRRLVARDFTPRMMSSWAPRIDELVALALEPAGGGEQWDFVSAVAAPLPVQVIAEVLGIPSADHADFKRWSDEIVEGFALTDPSDSERASKIMTGLTSLRGYLIELIRDRRTSPVDDLLSRLAAPRDDGTLDDDEVFWFCFLLLIAGNETTTNLLSNMVLAFLDAPSQWSLLQSRGEELVAPAVEEALRYDSPVQGFFRTALSQWESIPAGARVLLLFGAANRDPSRWPDADRFIIEREPIDHVAFGSGIHLCLGAHLARLEGAAVLRALASRYPDGLTLAGEVVRNTNPMLRGPTALPLGSA